MAESLKRTPLHAEHVSLGAKMVPFAGYEMPVQYPTGILEEHKAVRTRAGLFDVTHMGEFDIRGPDALALVQRVVTNDASKLAVGQAQYAVICYENGCAVDDCIVYRFADHYMIVVNASNRDKDRAWVEAATKGLDVQFTDRSDEFALLALQGPAAARILARLTDAKLDDIAYYHFGAGVVADVPAIIARTGYTGEDGFELFVEWDAGVTLWRALLEAGAADGIAPVGLGARDSLRLEVGYALYGNDIDETRTPLEAGLGWVTKLDKADFNGKAALVAQKEAGIKDRLVGFVLKERGFPRHGYAVHWNGEPAGVVTSGVVAPSLGIGVGMAYVPVAAAKPGTAIEIMIRGKGCPAEVVRPPFYKDGSIRR
jgi:aminomethyltransferase